MSRRLPVLAAREAALQTCGYCPKLCRGACPVSEAEPSESLTPWGKMTMAWLTERGDVQPAVDNAELSWACSGCHACQGWCEHDNPVFETLLSARAEAFARGVAPEAARRVAADHGRRARLTRERVQALSKQLELPSRADQALLVGCAYWLEFPDMAHQVVRAVQKLVGAFSLVDECCGAVLVYAGDRLGQEVAAQRIQNKLAGVERLIVHDPGCAMQLAGYPVQSFVKLADHERSALAELPQRSATEPTRWHDPCQLGRGLGQFDEPRRVLKRLLGRVPDEFRARREDSVCSGGGALLPLSYPSVSDTMALRRVREHESQGGGTIVTACAASLRRFRRSGARAVDIATLIAEGVESS